MRRQREDLFHLMEPLLPLVEKPTRYLDHEWGATKPEGDFHVCLMYPDTYEVGLPNMGLAILYRELNARPELACERSYLPWVDMAKLMRERNVPLLALESAAPVASFDVVGFTLAHEMACTNIIEALDLAGINPRAELRDEDDPIVFGGGPSVWNCEPVAPAFDAVLLGDGEEALPEMCLVVRDARRRGATRQEILLELAQVQGVYVPSLYEVRVDETSTRWGYAVPREGTGAPERVLKRVVRDFAATDPVPAAPVPYLNVVHDRLAIEVLRGCARGCRFCQAGITYRPVRERPADQVIEACERGLAATGYEEVSLTSLSTTDHSQCAHILNSLNERLEGAGVRVSIPSQRLDSFGVEMAQAVSSGKKGGLTFAPEAGSQRLRDVINKNVTELDLENAVRNAFELGWRRCKLYFMMGLPTETDDDIRAIVRLAERVMEIGREIVPKGQRGGLSVSISVAVFVPKSHTPFQWAGQLTLDEVRRRQRLLLESCHDRAVRISYHDASTSLLEAVLSRTGRATFDLIMHAWELGCKMDAWTDQFDFALWEQAAADCGYDLEAIAAEPLPLDARLPWDHTTPGVSKGFLQREWRRAHEGVTTADCTMTSCTGCGICPALDASTVLAGER